ncbi:DUF1631 family protein [Lysobacter solisilvae (ex Woo and Kim 2020)]|uniref:DUF1631 domain-containing protein n=1 Tax=Agrilutibacter terrestris TaxID=2865112 RepID=A0A7H0FXI4_9GAMM|nr:DUF1631 family protein [Lysobacter terrestris]QNP40750.1 DUF1631 domain-containing protein [Lysobacter terrestris]
MLLTAMQRISQEQLGLALERILRRADDYLFDSSSNGAGAELTALRDLRRARAQIAQRFDQSLAAGFRKLQEAPMATRAVDASSLSLVSDEALEEQLATEQVIDVLGRYHAPALELLDKRLAALTERPMLAARDNPVGPKFLADALGGSLAALDVSTAVRVVVYKFFERELSTALAPLYDRLNSGLVSAGILPHIKPTKRAEPLPQPTQPGEAQGVADPATVAVASAVASQFGMTGAGDQAMFSSLLGLLQTWRQAMHPNRDTEGGVSMSTSDVMNVLSLLQREPPRPEVQGPSDSRIPLAEQLRRDLLSAARRMGMGGDNISLSNVDEDAVDLVGMLFDVMLDERHFEADVRGKINRLLVPYIKVAVKDRRLFLYKAHPARRLLNAVAEASEGNRGESPQERELMARVDTIIDRLVAEFNEDIAIFETLEQELRSFMEQHRKRIEVTERRAAEAQRGKERLEQARESVSVDLAISRDTRELPPAFDAFINQYTAHHLTQIVLREGKDSPKFADAVNALTALMVSFDHAELGVPVDRLPEMPRGTLLAILESSGIQGHAADEVIASLQRTLQRVSAGENVDAIAEPLPVSPVAAAPEPPADPSELRVVAGKDGLDFDPDMAERMRALEVGTWLQLTSESGRVEPAKVSWISPISSRLLFVNRRGIRVLVASAEELAAMARLGRVQLREAETAFDDAIHQVMGKLKATLAPTAAAAPAAGSASESATA